MKKRLEYITGSELLQRSPTLGREKSISIIETDIPRTFPSLKVFLPGNEKYEALQRILEAFTMYRPDIG